MSLKDRIKSKSASLVKRKVVSLPDLGESVQVRSMMLGEINRITEAKGQGRQNALQIALTTEDPQTGESVWNPNSLDDIREIEGLSLNDSVAIINAGNEVSGIGDRAEAQGKGISSEAGEKNSAISSPSDSESPSQG